MAKVRPNTPDYGSRILHLTPKCEGRDVWELQIKLIGWGSGSDNDGIGDMFDPVRVTGTFDTTTRDAVARFQKAHTLPVTGVVDGATFFAIDKEAGLHAVLMHEMRCPCAYGKNTDPILCRCDAHPNNGVCTGFGSGRFAGQHLLDGLKLADDTDLAPETLDVYDMEEHAGQDKALLWAVRAMMHRTPIDHIKIIYGYRCWEDNYQNTDERRWHHRRSTFNLGKSVEFYHDGTCTWAKDRFTPPDFATTAACARCEAIRVAALAKCGFQLRWHEPDRVSVGEGSKDARPPVSPYAVHVNTVRRVGREIDDFVKTHLDGVKPLYPGKLGAVFPVDLGDGYNPRRAPSEKYFANTEKGAGGRFPMGRSRFWHGGVHLFTGAGTDVCAIADGEVIACRAGESETAKAYGSRNFVLLRHEYKTKAWYSLYMHLDNEACLTNSTIRWRQQLYVRSKDHVEAVAPCPFLLQAAVRGSQRLLGRPGIGAGELVETDGTGAIDPVTIDNEMPANCEVVKLLAPPNTFAVKKLETKDVGNLETPEAGLAAKLTGHEIVGVIKPIKVRAGEIIGKVGAAPTDAVLATHGSFLHVETFGGVKFLDGDGWVDISVASAADVTGRKDLVEELLDNDLAAEPPDKVLLDRDIIHPEEDTFKEALRTVVLQMPSEWALDWKAAVNAHDELKFMSNARRNRLGDAFNEYRWWADVSGAGKLPGGSVMFHYHPIAVVLALAYPD